MGLDSQLKDSGSESLRGRRRLLKEKPEFPCCRHPHLTWGVTPVCTSPPSRLSCLKGDTRITRSGFSCHLCKPFALQARSQTLHTTTLCWMELGLLGTARAAACPSAPHLEAAVIGCWVDSRVEAVCSSICQHGLESLVGLAGGREAPGVQNMSSSPLNYLDV